MPTRLDNPVDDADEDDMIDSIEPDLLALVSECNVDRALQAKLGELRVRSIKALARIAVDEDDFRDWVRDDFGLPRLNEKFGR